MIEILILLFCLIICLYILIVWLLMLYVFCDWINNSWLMDCDLFIYFLWFFIFAPIIALFITITLFALGFNVALLAMYISVVCLLFTLFFYDDSDCY